MGYPAQPSYPMQPVYPGQPGYPMQPGGYPLPVAPDSKSGVAIAGFVLGIIGMVAWLLPICGLPVTIAGIILGAMGRGSTTRNTLATIGLVLAIIGLVLSLGNAALGASLAAQHS